MKKVSSLLLCFAFFVMVTAFSSFAADEAKVEVCALSHGVKVISEQSGVAKSAVGSSVSFEAEDFMRMMNKSKISYITVTKAPRLSDGELLLGSVVINEGQTISAKNLGYLRYDHKSQDLSFSSFRFSVDGAAYDVECALYLLDARNSAPTLSVAPETLLDVSTHKNIMLYGKLPCYDPDGDKTHVEIVSYPKSGSLELCDRALGEYTYLPSEDFTGSDSFEYVAVDEYGNYSASKKVSLKVNKPKTSIVYADMTDSEYYSASLGVTEAGIMSGSRVGEHSYFYPDGTLTRAEFLVMAMKSVGITGVPVRQAEVFADNGDIKEELRGYVAAAYELGYISGTYEDGKLCFKPNEAITRAEAAVIVCNMIDAVTPTVTPTFADSDDIPAYASSAVNSLSYMGILSSDGGNISPRSVLTRAECAHLLMNVIKISK